ncbi:hypothetical protein CTHBC1_2655 [Acetivibrio thermocellus BC1]|nr:hypothetical protein CTHBC1_2655 [Acetivibrio thermocellus BC1]
MATKSAIPPEILKVIKKSIDDAVKKSEENNLRK